jgi:hypothetical protein
MTWLVCDGISEEGEDIIGELPKIIKIRFIPKSYNKLETYKSKIIIGKIYRSQEVASNKLEKGTLRDYKTGFCSPVALTVLEKKIFQ